MNNNVVLSDYLEESLNIKLNPKTAVAINNEASIVKLSIGDIVLHEGEFCSNLFFMISGIVRGYYIDKYGNDITKCFSVDKEFFCLECLFSNDVASWSLECVENCTCIKLPYSLIYEFSKFDFIVKDLIRDYSFKELINLENKSKNLLLMNAEQRYIDFCERYKSYLSRIPLKYIASYIGIRPSSLSRIRQKINKNIYKVKQN